MPSVARLNDLTVAFVSNTLAMEMLRFHFWIVNRFQYSACTSQADAWSSMSNTMARQTVLVLHVMALGN